MLKSKKNFYPKKTLDFFMPNKLILSENQKPTAVTQQGIESQNNYRQNKTFSRPQFIVPHHYFVTHFNHINCEMRTSLSKSEWNAFSWERNTIRTKHFK